MVNPHDNRPKFESMSGFQEIGREEKKSSFVENAEECMIILLEVALELTKKFFLPITVKFAIIYLVSDLIFYGADVMYALVRLIFLVILLTYERVK